MDADWVGNIAGILTTLAFIPQVIKVWINKSARDVSLLTFSAMVVGTFLWGTYGAMINSTPTVLANIVTFCLAVVVLGLKYRFREREKPTTSLDAHSRTHSAMQSGVDR